MRKLISAAFLCLAATLVQADNTTADQGKLLIIGGALRADNAAVHEAFINNLLPGGPVVIIPAASGQPARAASSIRDALVDHGLAADRIVVYPLAQRDDSKTPEVDESRWSDNAWSSAHVEKVAGAVGFWFTGGDQMRIVGTLRKPGGEESPLLATIRERLRSGAIIGGTSAGAAIMSRNMISGGDSFRALTRPLAAQYEAIEEQDSGQLSLDLGLGFFPYGVIDQHFDRKARLGRLVRAVAATGAGRGYGIDEDTALLVDLKSGRGTVLGSGDVTLLLAAQARFDWDSSKLAEGLRLGVAHEGVELQLPEQRLLKGYGADTLADAYFGYEPSQAGGMAVANPRLAEVLGYDLLDNRVSRTVDRYSVNADGQVLIYRFSQSATSRGFWHSDLGRYAIESVNFEVLRPR